jgi:hypothetical protein
MSTDDHFCGGGSWKRSEGLPEGSSERFSERPSGPSSDRSSERLSDRLKRLDQVQAAQEVPEFDLDAVMRGGERRVRRRTAVGTAALAAGAGLVLALAFAVSAWTDEEEAVPTPADLVYEQHDDSVVVFADGEPLARVELSMASLSDHGFGIVEVTVDSNAAFTLSPLDFIWASEALDQVPDRTQGELLVDGFQRFSWSYEEVSQGQLAWVLPGSDKPAAVWNVGSSAEPSAVASDQVWYLQREDSVIVYEGVQAQAKVSVSDVAVRGGTGFAQISLTARGSYALRADDFVWSSEFGVEHAPTADNWGSFEVDGAWGSIGSGSPLEFSAVQEGYLLWAPGGKETVGVWGSPEAGPLE